VGAGCGCACCGGNSLSQFRALGSRRHEDMSEYCTGSRLGTYRHHRMWTIWSASKLSCWVIAILKLFSILSRLCVRYCFCPVCLFVSLFNSKFRALSWSASNSSPVHVFEPFFLDRWAGQRSVKGTRPFLMDRFLMPIHTSCRSRGVVFTTMLFGCTRAICELKGIYNVYLKVLIYISIS